MHYQQSYRSQEGPRLDPPESAVPITGKEYLLRSVEEYQALESPGGNASNGQSLYALNCVVCMREYGRPGQGYDIRSEYGPGESDDVSYG